MKATFPNTSIDWRTPKHELQRFPKFQLRDTTGLRANITARDKTEATQKATQFVADFNRFAKLNGGETIRNWKVVPEPNEDGVALQWLLLAFGAFILAVGLGFASQFLFPFQTDTREVEVEKVIKVEADPVELDRPIPEAEPEGPDRVAATRLQGWIEFDRTLKDWVLRGADRCQLGTQGGNFLIPDDPTDWDWCRKYWWSLHEHWRLAATNWEVSV